MWIGQWVGQRYRIETQLGKGGMGTVWRAVDVHKNKIVAVKFLTQKQHNPRLRERFTREARTMVSIDHPNVVRIIDFGETDSGFLFIVMEHLDGLDLADRLEISPQITLPMLAEIIEKTLSGLHAVHVSGTIHRDIKPENIFLTQGTPELSPKLIDFGLSLDVWSDTQKLQRKLPTLTREGVVIGTLEYMSPEQARSTPDLDFRTDLYGMGAVIYRCLTGRLPFDADERGDLMLAVIRGGAPPITWHRPELGPALASFVERAMHLDRNARYASALDMRDAWLRAIEATANVESLTALPVQTTPARPWNLAVQSEPAVARPSQRPRLHENVGQRLLQWLRARFS